MFNSLGLQHVGDALRQLGGAHKARGILLRETFPHAELEKRAQGREFSRDGSFLEPAVVEGADEFADDAVIYLVERQRRLAGRRKEIAELLDVAPVIVERRGGRIALVAQVLDESVKSRVAWPPCLSGAIINRGWRRKNAQNPRSDRFLSVAIQSRKFACPCTNRPARRAMGYPRKPSRRLVFTLPRPAVTLKRHFNISEETAVVVGPQFVSRLRVGRRIAPAPSISCWPKNPCGSLPSRIHAAE